MCVLWHRIFLANLLHVLAKLYNKCSSVNSRGLSSPGKLAWIFQLREKKLQYNEMSTMEKEKPLLNNNVFWEKGNNYQVLQ